MNQLNLENIVFLDIETVPEHPLYSDLSDEKKQLWEHKSQYQRKEEYTPEDFYEKAGIWAEFGKIICISVGYLKLNGDTRMFRVTTFHGEEKSLLREFHNLLTTHFAESKYVLCAHNGKEFDFPYIARRMLIHGLPLPNKLNLFGKKPWEIPHLDTMELWKFGDYKHFTSLKLLTNVLGIPSPKDDIDGADVYRVFYIENDIDRIIDYCEKDVVAIAQIILRLKGDKLLQPEEIKQV